MFSTFDSQNKTLMNLHYLMWSSPLFIFFMSTKIKPKLSNQSSTFLIMNKVVNGLVSQTQSKNIGGAMLTFLTIFSTVLFLNLMGMIPYMFSTTSHLAINLSTTIPLWISIILLSACFNLKSFLSHFQPLGSPFYLNPLLTIIELVSNVVRPVTLALRLMANMTTGHVIMTLLGLTFSKVASLPALMISLIGMFYFLFEMAVCLIQAYIFTLLPTLYLDEHPTI